MEFKLDFFANNTYWILKFISDKQKEVNGKMGSLLSYKDVAKEIGIDVEGVVPVLQDLEHFGYIIVSKENNKPFYLVTEKGAKAVKLMSQSNFVSNL